VHAPASSSPSANRWIAGQFTTKGKSARIFLLSFTASTRLDTARYRCPCQQTQACTNLLQGPGQETSPCQASAERFYLQHVYRFRYFFVIKGLDCRSVLCIVPGILSASCLYHVNFTRDRRSCRSLTVTPIKQQGVSQHDDNRRGERIH
jgi:hypothetical protein